MTPMSRWPHDSRRAHRRYVWVELVCRRGGRSDWGDRARATMGVWSAGVNAMVVRDLTTRASDVEVDASDRCLPTCARTKIRLRRDSCREYPGFVPAGAWQRSSATSWCCRSSPQIRRAAAPASGFGTRDKRGWPRPAPTARIHVRRIDIGIRRSAYFGCYSLFGIAHVRKSLYPRRPKRVRQPEAAYFTTSQYP
jgi:hypothetical protein